MFDDVMGMLPTTHWPRRERPSISDTEKRADGCTRRSPQRRGGGEGK